MFLADNLMEPHLGYQTDDSLVALIAKGIGHQATAEIVKEPGNGWKPWIRVALMAFERWPVIAWVVLKGIKMAKPGFLRPVTQES